MCAAFLCDNEEEQYAMITFQFFKKYFWTFLGILLCLFIVSEVLPIAPALASERNYQRLVILGDPHLPGEYLNGKENTVKDINSWNDVESVVVLGDICEDLGTREEYDSAKQFFSKMQKPVWAINGNHDYIYEDYKSPKGTRIKGSLGSREAKLKLFKETFALPNVYYSKKVGNYLLVFLSADSLYSDNLTWMSDAQLNWLQSELTANKGLPTIIFYHAPLKGTLQNYNKTVNTEHFIAQPHDKIREIISGNHQVFLCVSGHTHTPATNESFNSAVNIFEKQVTNIHNANINRQTIWTNSLYLYPDKTHIKTYNHSTGEWLANMERTIVPGQK
jgi:3',5'-cyclic-AMP phosphodiesterase